MPTLKINGREVTVEKGMTILNAAKSVGIKIPHFCYQADLSIAGNCRICLVEVEKAPKLQTACSTEVADGMVVHTATEKVIVARRAIMEFLLINHPLDCPICDQAGECKLQDYSVKHGDAKSRFTEEKVKSVKREILGPHVIYDGERCIKCTRCIRFCEEITKTNELAMFFRGDRSTIGIFPGVELTNDYSGNVVDLCPVGALTLREFRFQARVWDLTEVDTICAACARGCNVIAGVKDGRIKRLTPRLNRQVNGNWMCDHGRLSYEALYDEERLAYPEIRIAKAGQEKGVAGELTRMVWKEALDASARKLDEILRAHGSGAVLFVILTFITNEDAFIVSRFMKDVFPDAFASVPLIERGEDDSLLIRKDKTPNRRGVGEILKAASVKIVGLDEAFNIMKDGRVKAVVVLGDGMGGSYRSDALKALRTDKTVFSLLAGSFRFDYARSFDALLPAAAWAETEGTFTNFEGFVQRISPAIFPFKQSRPLWQIVQELGARMGSVHDLRSASAVFERLSGEVPAFQGMHYRELKKQEARLKGA